MMRLRAVHALALLILSLALASLLPAQGSGPAAGEPELLILGTASNRGEVDPCG